MKKIFCVEIHINLYYLYIAHNVYSTKSLYNGIIVSEARTEPLDCLKLQQISDCNVNNRDKYFDINIPQISTQSYFGDCLHRSNPRSQ